MILQTMSTAKIRKSVEKALDNKRFEHTIGVAYTAAALAMRYEEDVKKAEIAGLLHDCAKCISNEKKLQICKKYRLTINEVEYNNPFLLHAKVGSLFAMKKYDIKDDDIINAILNHTTGCPAMSMLEKIIYIADYIEPNRKQAPNLTLIRRLAFENIDKALLCILEDTLKYLQSIEGNIDPMTQKTYDYYKEYLKNQE